MLSTTTLMHAQCVINLPVWVGRSWIFPTPSHMRRDKRPLDKSWPGSPLHADVGGGIQWYEGRYVAIVVNL